MLFDKAKIQVEGGRGGNGSVSFRREAHVPRGGPDGGDGGGGGDVVVVADGGRRDLTSLGRSRHFRAGRGGHGKGKRRHGQRGSRRRVARRDDQLDPLTLEVARDLAREAPEDVEWTRAVGKARTVSEVDEVLVRERDEALVEDGEAAHARVEDADRPWIHEAGV